MEHVTLVITSVTLKHRLQPIRRYMYLQLKHCEIVSEMTKTLKISLKKFAIESWDFKFNAKVQK